MTAALSGLDDLTEYHFRLVATSASGTTRGQDATFETLAYPPDAVTGAANDLAPDSATVGGTVNPNGVETSIYFEYGPTSTYGTQTPAQVVGEGTSGQAVSAGLAGLAGATTYHYRLVATSAAGTTTGADATFRTPAPPSAVTGAASDVTQNSATLNATVNPNGAGTTVYFEYGPTSTYGSRTPDQILSTGTTAQAVSAALSALATGVTFHFRVVATNEWGSTTGTDATFTPMTPPAPPPPVVVADTTAPLLTLTVKAGQKLPAALRKGLRATAGCSEACAMQAKLLIAKKLAKKLKLPTVLGKAPANLAAAGTTNLVVKFTAKAKRKLAKLRSVRVTLVLTATDPAGNTATARKAVTLRR